MTDREQGEPRRGVARAIAVLRAFAPPGAVSAAELARRAGISRPAAYRILDLLVAQDLVRRDPQARTYRLAPAILRISGPGDLLDQAAYQVMDELQRSVPWPATLATMRSGMMLMRETTRPTSPMVFDQAGVGFVWPVFETATGIACLSAYPPAQRKILLSAFLSGAMGKPPDPAAVERLIERAAEQGYSARPPGFARKTNAIAVPIPARGGPLGTIAFTFLNSAMNEKDAAAAYLGTLQQAAETIGANYAKLQAAEMPGIRTESRPRSPSP